MVTEFIMIILAFLGSILGVFLANIVKEEVAVGEKYFQLLKRALLLVLMVILLYPLLGSFQWILPFLGGAVLSFFLEKRYFYLGFALVVASAFSSSFFLLVTLLIFLYGLPYGTVVGSLKQASFLFFVPLFLFFFPELLVNNAETLLAVAAGTLFLRA